MVQEGNIPLCLLPLGTQTVSLEHDADKPGTYIRFIFSASRPLPGFEVGEEVSFEQIELCPPEATLPVPAGNGGMRFSMTGTECLIHGNGFTYAFSSRTALPTRLCYQDQEWLAAPLEWNTWRAPTDNDIAFRAEWDRFHLRDLLPRVYSFDVQESPNGVEIDADLSLGGLAYRPLLRMHVRWIIDEHGLLILKTDIKAEAECPPLPRLGIRLFCPADFEQVEYTGYGPFENYSDKKEAAWWGRFEETIDAFREDHVRPQESGAHTGCTALTIRNSRHQILQVYADQNFTFSLSRFRQEDLADARHRHEVPACESSVLCLDHAQAGIGSGSCGPKTADEYLLFKERYQFGFAFQPGIVVE